MPEFETPERQGVPVEDPKSSDIPLQALSDGPKDFWELYDIKKDPHNLHNLYGQKGYEAITADLKKKLTEQIKKYKDDEALKLVESKS